MYIHIYIYVYIVRFPEFDIDHSFKILEYGELPALEAARDYASSVLDEQAKLVLNTHAELKKIAKEQGTPCAGSKRGTLANLVRHKAPRPPPPLPPAKAAKAAKGSVFASSNPFDRLKSASAIVASDFSDVTVDLFGGKEGSKNDTRSAFHITNSLMDMFVDCAVNHGATNQGTIAYIGGKEESHLKQQVTM